MLPPAESQSLIDDPQEDSILLWSFLMEQMRISRSESNSSLHLRDSFVTLFTHNNRVLQCKLAVIRSYVNSIDP